MQQHTKDYRGWNITTQYKILLVGDLLLAGHVVSALPVDSTTLRHASHMIGHNLFPQVEKSNSRPRLRRRHADRPDASPACPQPSRSAGGHS